MPLDYIAGSRFELIKVTCFLKLNADPLLGSIGSRVQARSISHFRVPLCLCFKASLSAKPFLFLFENDFDLHENETAYRTHFHMKGFALRNVLKQRHKGTRKWPIG